MEKIPLLDLRTQYADMKPQFMAAMERVFDSGSFILGKEVEEFEAEICRYLGVKAAIAVSNGTDALWLALRAAGVKNGDYVLTSPFTFFGTVSAIMNSGGRPVFADADLNTFNIDPAAARKVLEKDKEKKIRAIMPIHLYGQAADMQELNQIAEEFNLPVIEDAAQAIGSSYQGKMVGGLGSLGCFSFYPTKNLGAMGDAGMVVTQNLDLAEKVKVLRNHGGRKTYFHDFIGSNCRMDAFQGALLRESLKCLGGWIHQRQEIAGAYNQALSEVKEVIATPVVKEDRNHSYHQYTIRVLRGSREGLQAHLTENGISSNIYYPKLCNHQAAISDSPEALKVFPNAERLAREVLSLPIYPALSESHVKRIADAIITWAKNQ